MNWEKEQLENYLKADKISHIKYGSELNLWKFLTKIYSKLNFIISNFTNFYYLSENSYQ